MIRVCDILRQYGNTNPKVSVQGVGYVKLDMVCPGSVHLVASAKPVRLDRYDLSNINSDYVVCIGHQPLYYSYVIGEELVMTSCACWNNTHLFTTLKALCDGKSGSVFYKGLPVTGASVRDGHILITTRDYNGSLLANELLALAKTSCGVVLETADGSDEFKHTPADIGAITCALVN